jgi:signal transduction histidine kinase
MARRRLNRYMGAVFMGVVIAPAVVLSVLAIRAMSHEEAYIEKQLEGTLTAEVAHVSGVVRAQIAEIQTELERTIVTPGDGEPSRPFALWRQRSPLVEVPFLLSSDYQILWPTVAASADDHRRPETAARRAEGRAAAEDRTGSEAESTFLHNQQAFLTDEEKTPVYENIAVAYKDEILRGKAQAPGESEGMAAGVPRPMGESEDTSGAPTAADGIVRMGTEVGQDIGVAWAKTRSEGLKAGSPAKEEVLGEGTSRQSAISQFLQSETVRKKVYDRARMEGQEIPYRNVEISDGSALEDAAQEAVPVRPTTDRSGTEAHKQIASETRREPDRGAPIAPERERTSEHEQPPASGEQPGPEAVGRIRSMFISQPLSFSEIVSAGQSGIIPRVMDGRLELLYWQRKEDGGVVGCLIDSREVRERIIGALPAIYSPIRILTVLDELGRPLIVPPGTDGRDWQRPFVAEEISETLPRWETAAYLTDPGVISSRAQVASSVMWMLILILFVSIAVGGLLVARSTYSEMRLAQQKTTFVANVSHELKTPLTSIRMFAEMLRDGHQPDIEKQRKYLDIMAAETERLTRLVNNVLDFSRMERGEKRYSMKMADLVALCSGVVESQRARIESNGFRLTFTAGADVLNVHADEEAIKQALINLLSNAEKYSTDAREIEVAVREEIGSAVIAVEDRGVGIPPKEAQRIFDEFYRVDDGLTSKVKGAGLGLTIARRILRDHGGDIRYRPRDGGGSTFEIVLPLAGRIV